MILMSLALMIKELFTSLYDDSVTLPLFHHTSPQLSTHVGFTTLRLSFLKSDKKLKALQTQRSAHLLLIAKLKAGKVAPPSPWCRLFPVRRVLNQCLVLIYW